MKPHGQNGHHQRPRNNKLSLNFRTDWKTKIETLLLYIVDYPVLPVSAPSKYIPPGTQKKKVVYIYEILLSPASLSMYQLTLRS